MAQALARAAGVAPRDVGYAGRKDRAAVTTQWFSVPGLDPERAVGIELAGVRVLEASPHPHKLRTGQLRGNRFDIVVREVDERLFEAARERWPDLLELGMPNRFGGQRFGRDGRNAELGRRVLRGESRTRDRRRARFWVSALQAEVFNQVLESRETPIGRLELGDVAVVHQSGGLFVVEDLEREAPRAAQGEISPTGPIFGTRVIAPSGDVAARERAILSEHGLSPDELKAPRGIQLRGARRALRVRPQEASLARVTEGMRVCFTLASGSYATELIRVLVGPDEPLDEPWNERRDDPRRSDSADSADSVGRAEHAERPDDTARPSGVSSARQGGEPA